ncbi:transposase InsO family protein [Leifsonia psychrotolerans]|uniref:Transposase InsO family protein n=1 Tax=Glaciibacter psychrotolerans TaxID=670054 RepID=A0A7Z0EDJ2_9MICO|nr:IS481 family transposase [Leifsonia psychrotolerans]NYJ19528.1 transposase InsO family protein [Leifsonia psychrotolerans]
MPNKDESVAEIAARVSVEIKFRAVTAVREGSRIVDVAEQFGVSRQTVTAWKKRYDADGLAGLAAASRRPHSSPNRIAPEVEAWICEMRREHRRWGARRIAYELKLQIADRGPSRSTVHRVLVRNGLVNAQEQQHKRVYKRWARETPMHLWQLDLVGGVHIEGGRECKILTGIDDHSRFVVVAAVLERPSGIAVVEAFIAAMHQWGVPFEVLTDNGKQFTGKFTRPLPVEVLFERTCREHGISARLTKRRSPTTTGKIERFHRTLRRELLDEVGAFASIEAAQAAVTEWVHAYNTQRPHQSLDMATPASLFRPRPTLSASAAAPETAGTDVVAAQTSQMPRIAESTAPTALEIDLRVPPSGVVALAGIQQLWLGKALAGQTVTIWTDLTSTHTLLGDEVIKTIPSRLTTADLDRLKMRGARPGRSEPALPAVNPDRPSGIQGPVEVDRTATRDGVVTLLGHHLTLGVRNARQRVTLRIDGGLIHVIAGGHLVKTMPNPLSPLDAKRLSGVRQATTPLPPAPASGPQRVQRTVPKDGVVMVAGQRLRVGRTHTGKIITVIVEDHHFRVLDGEAELSLHARTSTKAIRNFNAHRSPKRQASPDDITSKMS